MEKSPLVSVLCLCYNQSQFVVESLESIKGQSYKNFEILICDDCSQDKTAQVVDTWINENPQIKIRFIKHQKNQGITKSLNEILNLAKGEYIQLLALDDVLVFDKFERHVKILKESSSKEALVFSDSYLIDENSELYQNKFLALHIKYLRLETGNFYDKLIQTNFIPAMSILLKKDYLVKENGFDEDLSYEDYDMWLRLSEKYDFIFDSTVSCYYRLHSNNTHKKTNFGDESLFKIGMKHKKHPAIKQKIFDSIETSYINRTLKNQHLIYYKHFSPNSKFEKLILWNKFPKLYVFLKDMRKLFYNLLK